MKKLLLSLSVLLLCGTVYFASRPGDSTVSESTRSAIPGEEGYPPPAAQVRDFGMARARAANGEPERKLPDFQPLHAFNSWVETYMVASPGERVTLIPRGTALAKARRPEFKRLIKANPQLALETSVRPVVRQDLPLEVQEQLETPVSARGDYKAYFGRAAEGVELPPDQELVMRYFETPEGKSYKANVYGSQLETISRKNIALRGVAVDRELAVSESPVRQLESGERIAPGTAVDQTCPVSNITTPADTADGLTVDDETPVVELGGRLILLCNGTHVRIFDEAERQASGGPGVSGYFKDTYPGTSSEAIGNFRCLYIRVTYPDQMRAPNSEATAQGDMRNVSRYYLESSFGRLTTTATVTPLIVMPHTKAWYIAKDDEVDGLGLVHSDARSEARRLGYDSNQYNCTIVRVNEGPRLSGISWGGGDSVWVSWDGMDVLDHECGHSLGRNHANFWKTSDGSAIGVGANQEYGNSLDVMGGGGGFGAHYNSYSKRSLGWLPDSNVHRPAAVPSSNGIYRLYAYDQPVLEEGKRYSFRMDKDPQRRFYLEYHPAAGGQWVDSVTMILSGLGSNAGHLIDTTPGSPGGKGDGGIRVGRTFSDFESDTHFTVVSKNATTPPSMDVAVMRGPFPDNLPPVATLAASATTVAVGGSLTFTATASDPNGDPLAYSWDFSDAYAATNTPVITRTFPTADQQTVELTVSDMKGGVVRRNVVITVGNPGRAVLRGRITAGGQPLMGVRVTSDTDKYCYTDVNGDYALADLQTGSRTFTATLMGYTFTPAFTNPLTLTTSGATAQNWTATSVPEVTLTAMDAAEGGANGSFVLTRTGDISAALTVTVAPVTGSATKTTDYTLSPDYTTSGSMATYTIPAGQASLNIVVAAVNDTAQEGPETVQLQLAAGPYQVREGGVARLTIQDNDTTRPVVSIAATDFYATETPGDTGTYLISRTGSTASALSVSLDYGGTATRGQDYPALSTTFTIPAGQSSATLSLVPVDDAVIEIPEDVTLSVAANAAYIVDSTASSATVTITDNDLATVGVTVLDDTLNEAGRGTGTVLVTRTGNLSQPLTVYYGLSGRALHGRDYVALPGQITLAAGMASAPIVITPYDDDIGEVDESITLNLTSFDNAYTLGPNYSASLTIKDNADPPLVTVTANSAAEPSTNGTFTFTATGSITGNITVKYTLSSTAIPGSDYTAPSGSVVISGNGTNIATVNIPVLNNSVGESTKTIILTITPGATYSLYNDAYAVMRLKDDDAEPVSVSTHSATLAEPSSASSFYISRNGSSGNLTVTYTMSGTATNGTDYNKLPGTVVIPDGSTGVDIAVTPINDTLAEGTETVTLNLAAGTGYGVEVGSATLYLQDNDNSTMPAVGFAATTGTTSEAPDAITGAYRDIEVTLTPAHTGPVTVEYVSSGGTAVGDDVDWSYVDPDNGNALISRGLLTFPAGVTSKFVRIKVRNDGILEGSETVILELRNVNNGRLSSSRSKHTLTITDNAAANPVPRVSFLTSATTRSESDGTEPLLIASLDVPSASPVTVSFTVSGTATAGADYTLPSGTLTFAAGEMFKKLPLVIIPDGVNELAETVVVTLSNPSGAQLGGIPTHTVTISDNNAPVITVTASSPEAVEDSGTGLFTFTRSGGAANLAVTVRYATGGTAAGGVDYTALPGTVLIPAGQTSVSVAVNPLPNTVEQPARTVVLTLADDPNYEIGLSSEATVTIVDDDAAPVITRISPVADAIAIPAGVGLRLEVESTRETPSGTAQVPVAWSMVSGPGAAVFESPAGRMTGVTFPVNGTYVLRATATHGSTVTSDLTVAAGLPLFRGADIGTTTAAGTVSTSGATYTLSGAGSGLSSTGTADGFTFLAIPRAGDFDLKCRVLSVSNPGGNGSCRVGLMVRAEDSPGSPYIMSLEKADGTHSQHTRLTADAATAATPGNTAYTFPHWVRVVRSGNNFSTWHGTDGTTWSQRGTTQSIPDMGNAPLVGLAVTSAVPGTVSTAVFDSLNFQPASNTGPYVNAGAALSGGGPFNLDATISDDALPLPITLTSQWSKWAGPGNVTFGNASFVDTTAAFSASGLYTLRLTVSDGLITTYDDTTANVSVQSPIEAWRAAKFGASASDPLVAGDLADGDSDGLTNLVEYALNSDPGASVAAHLPVASLDEGTLTLTYRVNLAATDVVLAVQSSADLSAWSPAPVTFETLSDDGQTRVIRASMPATLERRFLRLEVSR